MCLAGLLPAKWGSYTNLAFVSLHNNPGLTGPIPDTWDDDTGYDNPEYPPDYPDVGEETYLGFQM
jgi:hypothetical protein